MRYDPSAATGDVGEAAAALIVARHLKWIFRKVSGPDFGIDLVAEQVVDNEATGRWVSLQIKSGSSYFDESGPDGVVFRDSADHLEYYLNHQLPVAVVLHDPHTDLAIWQWVSSRTAERTGKGYKVLVPHAQTLDAGTASEWSRRLGRRRPAALPPQLKVETRPTDGSLSTIHDVLEAAEDEVLVAAPFLSVEFLALLDFMATRLTVRVLTSTDTFNQRLLAEMGGRGRIALRVVTDLHTKVVVVDRQVACQTSANFSARRMSAAREVALVVASRETVGAMTSAFEEAWSRADPAETLFS